MVVRDQGEQLPLIWNEFNECARLLGREEALHDLLQESLERRSSSAVICALFDLKRFLYGASPAIDFLLGQVAVYRNRSWSASSRPSSRAHSLNSFQISGSCSP